MLKITITGDKGEGKSTLANIICGFLQQETNYQIYLESDIDGEVKKIINTLVSKEKLDKRNLCLSVKNGNKNNLFKEHFPPIDRNNLTIFTKDDEDVANYEPELITHS